MKRSRIEAKLCGEVTSHTHPGGSGVPAWSDITDKPATFPPDAHTHAIADTTGLQAALDGKAASGHTHAGVYEPADAAIQTHILSAHAPSNAQKNADITKAEIEAKLTGVISSHSHAGGGGEAFPVGSVFIAVVSTNPATLLGYGTWSAFAAGRMLVGLDAADVDFDTVEETGGSKTHTLTESEIPSHTHTVTDPGHTHVENSNNATTGGLRGWAAADTSTNTPTATGYSTASAQTGITLGATGGGAAHNNLPPYIVCYMWLRTA